MGQRQPAVYDAEWDSWLDWEPDPVWLRNRAAIEAEYLTLSSTGSILPSYTQAIQSILHQFKIYQLLAQELRHWLLQWDLESGLEPAVAVATERLRSHLDNLDPISQARFDTLLINEARSVDVPRKRALALIFELLLPEDFQAIARAAVVHAD